MIKLYAAKKVAVNPLKGFTATFFTASVRAGEHTLRFTVIAAAMHRLCLKKTKSAHTNKRRGRHMKKDNSLMLEIMARELRLIYYNDYLLKNGVITKREHDKMYLAVISKRQKGKQNESDGF